MNTRSTSHLTLNQHLHRYSVNTQLTVKCSIVGQVSTDSHVLNNTMACLQKLTVNPDVYKCLQSIDQAANEVLIKGINCTLDLKGFYAENL